jgi:hypothetical protein
MDGRYSECVVQLRSMLLGMRKKKDRGAKVTKRIVLLCLNLYQACHLFTVV